MIFGYHEVPQKGNVIDGPKMSTSSFGVVCSLQKIMWSASESGQMEIPY